LDRFARIVLGYHGCNTPEAADFGRLLLDGKTKINNWRPSANDYDWLGQGIYFWEHSPERAQEWAGPNGVVIGAIIQLGSCLDLTDLKYTSLLRSAYQNVAELFEKQGRELPKNGGRDLKLRKLDCLIINHFVSVMGDKEVGGGETVFQYQTIRCPFEEGEEVFPGSMLKMQTHIQIAVRDPDCIVGVFRPNL
jgi:hypothetical protein